MNLEHRRPIYRSIENDTIVDQYDFEGESYEDLTNYDETDVVHEEYEAVDLSPFSEDEEENSQAWKINRPTFLMSLWRCVWLTMQTTMVCGVIFGVIGTFLWWLEQNLTLFCLKFAQNLDGMPMHLQRIRLTTVALRSMIIEFWSFIAVVPVFDWTFLKQLNLPIWNVLTAFINALCQLVFALYGGLYHPKWTSYISNVLFFFITYFNYTRIARHKKRILRLSAKSIFLASKLGTQFILGLFVTMFSDYILFPAIRNMSQFERVVTVSLLPLFVMIPKLVASFIVGRLTGLFSPGKAVMFTIVAQVSGALACRFVQAFLVEKLDTKEFNIFVITSLAHAVLKILDKILLPLKERLCQFLFRAKATAKRPPRVSRLLADQYLIDLMTETSALLINCAAVYLIKYFYSRYEGTRDRKYRMTLFISFLKRVGVCVLIDSIASVIALKILTYRYNIPVIKVWSLRWRWVIGIHLIQIMFAMIIFPMLISEAILKGDVTHVNGTSRCDGPFQDFI
eukprot:Seg34.4 transcript_id=Seg34.4/GoldUCD/mRNA.D3Y31 product="hypothetical protein" protein_id=Seg34.4/GoldUCD/D3Y31